jgi:hypothetical protein
MTTPSIIQLAEEAQTNPDTVAEARAALKLFESWVGAADERACDLLLPLRMLVRCHTGATAEEAALAELQATVESH